MVATYFVDDDAWRPYAQASVAIPWCWLVFPGTFVEILAAAPP